MCISPNLGFVVCLSHVSVCAWLCGSGWLLGGGMLCYKQNEMPVAVRLAGWLAGLTSLSANIDITHEMSCVLMARLPPPPTNGECGYACVCVSL